MSFPLNGPQAGKSWTPLEMSRAAQTVKLLGDTSFWVCPAKNSVFGVYLYSPYAFPNSVYPYQLRIWSYAPSANYYADSQQWLGGVAVDGTINPTEMNNSWKGTLINKDQIMWNDGSLWIRTQPPPRTDRNPYSAQSAYNQATDYSAYINTVYNRAYPNLYKFNPY